MIQESSFASSPKKSLLPNPISFHIPLPNMIDHTVNDFDILTTIESLYGHSNIVSEQVP